MPTYKYTAKNINNKIIKNIVESKDPEDLNLRVRDEGLVLLSYRELGKAAGGNRLRAGEIAEYSRQMASMLGSGITVARAMDVIKDRPYRAGVSRAYNRLFKDVQAGNTLSEAMRMQEGVFPELFVNMIASGEASGRLEDAIQKMAVQYDKEDRLNKKINAAMTYPKILIVMLIGSVAIIFTSVLPTLFDLFEEMEIPPITAAIITASKFLQMNWVQVLIGIAIAVALYLLLSSINTVAYYKDVLRLKIPRIGRLVGIIYTARFSRTLSSLYSSGLAMTNALDISATIVGNRYIKAQFVDVVKAIRNGESLSAAIANVDGFDSKLITAIMIGEESGRLDTMLQSMADSFDYEAQLATERMVELIQPVMLVLFGGIIGTIMVSVFIPIITMYQSIG